MPIDTLQGGCGRRASGRAWPELAGAFFAAEAPNLVDGGRPVNNAAALTPGRGGSEPEVWRLSGSRAGRGLRTCGAVQNNPGRAGTGPRGMDAGILPDGPVARVSRDLGMALSDAVPDAVAPNRLQLAASRDVSGSPAPGRAPGPAPGLEAIEHGIFEPRNELARAG